MKSGRRAGPGRPWTSHRRALCHQGKGDEPGHVPPHPLTMHHAGEHRHPRYKWPMGAPEILVLLLILAVLSSPAWGYLLYRRRHR